MVQSNTSKNTHGFGDNKSPALLKINKNTNNVYNDEPQSSELWGHLSIKGKYSTCFGSIYTTRQVHYLITWQHTVGIVPSNRRNLTKVTPTEVESISIMVT